MEGVIDMASKTNKANPSLPREIVVPIGHQEVVVRKMPLGRISKFSSILDGLPDVLQELTTDEDAQTALKGMGSNDYAAVGEAVTTLLPKLLTTAQDFAVNLLATGAELDRKFLLEEVGIDDAMAILLAIFEVNNLAGIKAKVGKLAGLFGVDLKEVARKAQERTQIAEEQTLEQTPTSGSKTSSKSSPTP